MKILAVIRAGKSSIHMNWLRGFSNDSIDFVLSTYDQMIEASEEIKFLHYCKGPKLNALKDFYIKNQELVKTYDFIWSIEDDLYIPIESILEIINFCKMNISECFQPSLSLESYFSHPITVQNNSFDFRITNFVEIMSPIFSLNLFLKFQSYFDFNKSGWGQEWIWNKFIIPEGKYFCILDCAPITHTRSIGSGDLYSNNNQTVENAREEMNFLLKTFEVNPIIETYYGCSRNKNGYFVSNSNFKIFIGYFCQISTSLQKNAKIFSLLRWASQFSKDNKLVDVSKLKDLLNAKY